MNLADKLSSRSKLILKAVHPSSLIPYFCDYYPLIGELC